VKSVDERLRADLQPTDIVDKFLAIDIILDSVQEFNLFVKLRQIRLLSSHIAENLLLQVFELEHLKSNFLVKFLRLFILEQGFLLGFVLDFKVGSRLKELVEGLTNSFFPQEFPLAVLI
jgi:hypothetical protein